MPDIIEITDLNDDRIGLFTRLTEAQLRNRLEPEKGIFIAESAKVVRLALEMGCEPVAYLMERRQLTNQGREFIENAGSVPIFTADDEVLEGLTGYRLYRGVLAAMRRPKLPSVDEVLKDAHRVAVLEGIVRYSEARLRSMSMRCSLPPTVGIRCIGEPSASVWVRYFRCHGRE